MLTDSLIELALDESGNSRTLREVAGKVAYAHGDSDEAVRLIESAMFEISLSISGQLTLANAWMDRDESELARSTLRFLVEIIDRVPCSYLPELTHALARVKEYELAIVVCRNAFDRHPEDDNAIFGAAFYMNKAGYPPELIRNSMRKAVDLNPDSQLYGLNLAVLCCALRSWDEAYRHACRLSDAAIRSIPCKCLANRLKALFQRFDDAERLELISEQD